MVKDLRQLARKELNNSIRRGHIVRPEICSKCESVGLIEGHHSDYSKPLDVMWLCKKCHVKLHTDYGTWKIPRQTISSRWTAIKTTPPTPLPQSPEQYTNSRGH